MSSRVATDPHETPVDRRAPTSRWRGVITVGAAFALGSAAVLAAWRPWAPTKTQVVKVVNMPASFEVSNWPAVQRVSDPVTAEDIVYGGQNLLRTGADATSPIETTFGVGRLTNYHLTISGHNDLADYPRVTVNVGMNGSWHYERDLERRIISNAAATGGHVSWISDLDLTAPNGAIIRVAVWPEQTDTSLSATVAFVGIYLDG